MKALTPGAWLWSGVAVIAVALLLLAENAGAQTLDRVLLYLPGVDKSLHAVQSALIFGAMFYFLRPVPFPRHVRLVIAAGLAVALALFDEWQQQWMAGRTVELADLVAGGSGVVLGIGAAQRSVWGRKASAVMAAAVIAASLVTYSSYISTKDYKWGLLAEGRSDLISARRHFLDAANAGASTAELYNALAWTEVESGVGDASRAVEYAERSLAMRPGDSATLDTYGWALYKAGRAPDAIVPLAEALRKDPRIYCVHYHLGAAYLAIGDHASARRHLEAQRREQPQTREATLAVSLLREIDSRPGR